MKKKWTGIVLAAGAGKRMGGGQKVMQLLAGLPMLGHVLNALSAAGADEIILVLSPKAEETNAFALALMPNIKIVRQPKPKGTADAVRIAMEKASNERLVVAYGDTPLVLPKTFRKLAASKTDLTLTGFKGNKKGYGRILFDKRAIVGIQEDDGKTALGEGYLNGGLMALSRKKHKAQMGKLKNNNPKKEFYLTDLAFLPSSKTFIECDEEELLGANRLEELARLESLYQARTRSLHFSKGVYMVAPESVFFSWDTKIAKGVRIEPFVVFGRGVKIAKNVEIKSFCHIEGADIGADAIIGPYARLRPQTKLSSKVHIGNFVEVKNSRLGEGTKANHLTYLGDSDIGKRVNIGAGTITCNYDGKDKHKTQIDDGAFIGSNSALVAPIKIARGAYIGSGSVITKSVPAKTLVVARGRQTTIRKIKGEK